VKFLIFELLIFALYHMIAKLLKFIFDILLITKLLLE